MDSPTHLALGDKDGVHVSINSISGISHSSAASQLQGGFRAALKQAMTAVADKLGMSVTDLQAQLKGGKSLADVAGAKGISATDLLATIKQAIGSSGVSGKALDVLANRVANHEGGHDRKDVDTQAASSGTARASSVDKDGDDDGR